MSIHIAFARFGTMSVFPARRGTQKLCTTSWERSRRKVGCGRSTVLTGTCSSFAVTIPSSG